MPVQAPRHLLNVPPLPPQGAEPEQMRAYLGMLHTWLRLRLDLIDTQNDMIYQGTGSPAGVVAAKVGSLYLRTDGGATTTFYVKESGNLTTAGWVAK